MSLDAGWTGAIASLASAFIVAITTIAAFRQLRHYRNANEIVVYLRLIDTMDSASILGARRSLAAMAQRVATDTEFREALRDPNFIPEDFAPIGELLRFLEHISVLVTKGGVAESLVLAEYADTFVDVWELMRETVSVRRIAYGQYTGRAFEHLAMRAKQYIDSGAMERDYAALERDPRG